jgi:hypothetical protein
MVGIQAGQPGPKPGTFKIVCQARWLFCKIFYHGRGRLSIVLYSGTRLIGVREAAGVSGGNFPLAIRQTYVTMQMQWNPHREQL